MNAEQLYSIIENYFGYKIKMLYMNSKTKTVGGILYNSFFLECDVDDRYGRFGAGICLGDQKYTITEFLGKHCSPNSDEKSIKESLKIIDRYCRLRLPDKFLDEYDKVYAWDNISVLKRLGCKKFPKE